MRRTRTALATLTTLSVCLMLGACGGDKKEDDSSAPASDAPTSEAAEPQTWPLTGLPVKDGEAAKDHPVYVLKMDNTANSAPQQGLGSADLVVEELVEGGATRLAAFYDSKIPGDVGPVRSMRASDIGIVTPADATVVTSGAAAPTIARLKKADISWVTEGSEGFFREDSRSAPYNLFANLQDVAKAAKEKAVRPEDYLPFGSVDDLPKGQKATSITAAFSAGHTTEWTYRDGTYVNDNSFAAEGDQFPADTILVLRVKVGDAGYVDPAGNPVPETKFEGSGEALLFHGGRLVRGTWTKDALESTITLSTKEGDLTVPAGRTWIELVPQDGGDVTFK